MVIIKVKYIRAYIYIYIYKMFYIEILCTIYKIQLYRYIV